MNVGNVTAPASTSTAVNDKAKLAGNFNNFLKLLTSQMKNQDPMSPLKATEFTSQLAQFSAVEQAINTNVKLEELLAAQTAGQTSAAVAYLGTTVEATGNTAALTGGRAEWGYQLGGNSNTTEVRIINSQGQTVRTLSGATSAGAHQFVWDGLNDSGTPQPDGNYTIQVTARDTSKASVPVQTNFVGRVTGISVKDNGIVLSVNGNPVALSNVISVKQTEAL